MSTPTEKITDAAASIPTYLEGMDLRKRLDVLLETTEAAQELLKDLGMLRAQAMQAYVSAVGASAAARELGISRSRVYQLLAAADDRD